jgi:16S rRNA (cytosine1402-N4)-methyltransferase
LVHYHTEHIPVLLDEVVHFLNPEEGDIIVDGTFGGGSYTEAFLKAANCRVIGIDKDPYIGPFAEKIQTAFPDRFQLLRGSFGNIKNLLSTIHVEKVQGFVLDIGVSSFQLDEGERGFSFRLEGPLDMRMDPSSPLSAYDLVNTFEEQELANIIYKYGDERYSRRIASSICKQRALKPIKTTLELAELVAKCVPHYDKRIDPATRTFQALRIYINDELKDLEQALEQATDILAPGGRLIVVTFHSLEDEIVKRFLIEKSTPPLKPSRYHPEVLHSFVPQFKIITKKTIKPSDEEVKKNIRARSGKLRAAIRL